MLTASWVELSAQGWRLKATSLERAACGPGLGCREGGPDVPGPEVVWIADDAHCTVTDGGSA